MIRVFNAFDEWEIKTVFGYVTSSSILRNAVSLKDI